MKKILLLPIALVAFIFIILHFGFGTRSYHSYASYINLDIPNISFNTRDSHELELEFISFRSMSSLNNEIESMLSGMVRDECAGNSYYFDVEQDITITSFFVRDRFLFREFGFVFERGRECIPLQNNDIDDEIDHGDPLEEEEYVETEAE